MRMFFLTLAGFATLLVSACGNNCNTYPNYSDASCPNYVNPAYQQQPYGGYPQQYPQQYPQGGGYPQTGGYPQGGYYPQQGQLPPCSPTSGPNCRRY